MRLLVGADRRAAADALLGAFDAVVAGGGPLVVSLEGSLGLGKTRLVQELYQRLAAERQGVPAYWPRTVDWREAGTRPDILQARKQVEPAAGWVIPGGAQIPWLWWAIPCQLTHAGNPMRAMKDASAQLGAHLDPLVRKLERSTKNRDDALAALGGLFDLAGVFNPGSAIDAGQTFLGIIRRRLQQAVTVDRDTMDRRVETKDDDYSSAVRTAESLLRVSGSGTPVVLVVDDAHWADPGLVSLLRHLAGVERSLPILIITTAWPEKVAPLQPHPPESVGAWLAALETIHPGRLRRFPLGPIAVAEMSELVLAVAPRTEPGTAMRIAGIASGNPLVLNLLLDLDLVRQDISADGRIDTDPARLDRLPSDIRTIYQDLWRQLPPPIRRVLALVAIQGSEFLPAIVDVAAQRLQMHEELVKALPDAIDRYHWIRATTEDRWEFTERPRFEIADELITEVFDPEQVALVQAAIVEHVLALKASPRWADLDEQTRRVALESHLEADEDLDEAHDRDALALADTRLQLAAIELEVGAPERAVALARAASSTLDDAADVAARSRVRRLLAEALVAAGRPDEAIPILAEMGAVTAVQEVASAAEALTAARADDAGLVESSQGDAWARVAWTAWRTRPLPSLPTLKTSELASIVCEVVAAEGPVFAARVYDVLRAASGAPRQTKAIRFSLDRAVRTAVRRGDLVVAVPGSHVRSERRVLRLPGQAEDALRTMGDRAPADVPPAEIAELARRVAAREPTLDRAALKRSLGQLLGQKLMTKTLDALLEAAVPVGLGLNPSPVASPPVPVDEWGRIAWTGWTTVPVPALATLMPAEIGAWLTQIVEAEGPVVAGRAFGLLAKAAGAPRMSASVVGTIESGLASAVRRGEIVVLPGRRGAPQTRTLRLPEHPEAVLRLPGDRLPIEIPKAELAELATRVAAARPELGAATTKREVARLVGFGRYTEGAEQLLTWALGAASG